ncbi:MAG: hypothetical protein HOV81_45335 [Kofleriaceae bacterium]|nr:hypothetical protein [Kofleriaceae bacterium]
MLAKLAKKKGVESYVVTALPVGDRLYVGFNVVDGDEDFVGSAAISVDLATLSATLVYESTETMIDYVVDPDGWQCMLMHGRVVEVEPGSKPVETTKKVPDGLYRMSSLRDRRVAICGDSGKVVLYAKRKFAPLKVDTGAEDPAYAEDLVSVHFAAPNRSYAVGSYGVFLKGDAKQLAPAWSKKNPFAVKTGRVRVLSVYETKSGAVLLGSDEGPALVFDKGKFTKLAGLPKEASVYAMVEHGGKEYWSTTDNLLFVRTGTKLKKQRGLAGGYRMESNGKVMASSCGSFVYLHDGAAWTRLRINPNPKKLVERLKLDF